jgi:hypothetical protein
MIEDNKFHKLKNEIERGQIRYFLKSTLLPTMLVVIIGKFLAAYYFENKNDIANLFDATPGMIILLLLFGGFSSIVSFQLKYKSYQKELTRRNNT